MFWLIVAPTFISSWPPLDFTSCSCARFPSLARKGNLVTVGKYKICVAVVPPCVCTWRLSVLLDTATALYSLELSLKPFHSLVFWSSVSRVYLRKLDLCSFWDQDNKNRQWNGLWDKSSLFFFQLIHSLWRLFSKLLILSCGIIPKCDF